MASGVSWVGRYMLPSMQFRVPSHTVLYWLMVRPVADTMATGVSWVERYVCSFYAVRVPSHAAHSKGPLPCTTALALQLD